MAEQTAPSDVADEPAAFADEALEWAELTLPTALEGWPGEWPHGERREPGP